MGGCRFVAALVLMPATAGCSVPMAAPPASFAAVRQLGSAAMAPLAVGSFTAPASLDRPISVRAAVIKPPRGGGFAAFLTTTLAEQLRLAGKLDPAASSVVGGEITESRISEGLLKGSAVLAARFTLRRGGTIRYDRTLRVEAQWTSSLIGAIAIQAAEQSYSGLYGRLVETLVADADFQRAAA